MEQNQNIDLHSNTDTSKSTSTRDRFNRVIQYSHLKIYETEGKLDKINKRTEISNKIYNIKKSLNIQPRPTIF